MEWCNEGIMEFWNYGMLEWWNYGWGIDGIRMMMMVMIKNQWNGLMTVLTVSSILCYCRLSIDHLPLGVCLMYHDATVCLASDGLVFHTRKYCKWGRNKALTKIKKKYTLFCREGSKVQDPAGITAWGECLGVYWSVQIPMNNS